ncbi:NADH-cytochrome b5 reductase-like protein [Zancudomyces culisetae]|uniref:cytochrome-b5 reductase n=1 Tax=Zancudomyces culisetae TaxID=1213189 RepID=A0A1R1PWI6_ZANCU|nr:NADH-cytochrome b5 reductase-like protein [Zancudomyces culisetae]|eukprot:OMH85321.1 NADH-cytochrome b5 reductase-like protein [Zancudomyces culisetae]
MFSRVARKVSPVASRFYSTQPAAGSKGKAFLYASLLTGGILAGSYLYTSKKPETVTKVEKMQIEQALNPEKFVPFELAEVEKVSDNTRIFRFKLEEGQQLGMTVASCLLTLKPAEKEGEKDVVRPYTPITDEETTGHFDLLIKEYPTGVMSKHITSLKPGDKLMVKGPIPKYKYAENTKKEIGMIAGGTGITPMLQVIHKVLKNPSDSTKVSLLFANVSEKDILLKSHLDALASAHPDRFKVQYIIDKPVPGWKGETGYVTADMAQKYMPDVSMGDDCVVFVCGPPGMMKSVSGSKKSPTDQGPLVGILKELGYTENYLQRCTVLLNSSGRRRYLNVGGRIVANALNPEKFVPFEVSKVERVSDNTKVIRFKLQEGQRLGLPVCSSLYTLKPAEKQGEKDVTKPYTPITDEETTGHFDLLIKEYPTGVMSKHITSLKPGDKLMVKGPILKYKYAENTKKEIGMIAGGTGITPMLQVIHKVLKNPSDSTKLSLLFANVSEKDILLKSHLDALASAHPDRFKVQYVIDKPAPGWKGETGYVTADMAQKYMPDVSMGDDCVVFVCGPPGMMKSVSGPKRSRTDQGPLVGILKELGYTESNVCKF